MHNMLHMLQFYCDYMNCIQIWCLCCMVFGSLIVSLQLCALFENFNVAHDQAVKWTNKTFQHLYLYRQI